MQDRLNLNYIVTEKLYMYTVAVIQLVGVRRLNSGPLQQEDQMKLDSLHLGIWERLLVISLQSTTFRYAYK